MKREGGLWATAAVLGVAATVGISSTQTPRPSDTAIAPKTVRSSSVSSSSESALIDQGPCPDIERLIQTFLLIDEKEVVAPPSCFPHEGQAPLKSATLLDEAKKLRFVIAILPDPLHTHFPLIFDRGTEAIQEAAQDDDSAYVYNSSWMPWETQETSYALLDDQDKADERKEQREDQPGILLFRGKLPDARPSALTSNHHPFDSGLVVLIVGEEPTGGIHRRQFENAVQWITALQPSAGSHAPPVQILGPTFSGSIPSLINLLRETKSSFAGRAGEHLRIFSGTISSNAGVAWLNRATHREDLAPLHIDFRSFEHSGNLDIDRYCRYISAAGMDLEKLAIVSEDETAFGGEYENGGPDASPCHPDETSGNAQKGPVYLYYPRDISALRAAYQNQSIFSHASAQPGGDASHRSLQTNIADPEAKDHDTIQAYGGEQTALSQEAELQQIVSLMRAHNTEYILVRSSNPLDQLFLSHFFRMLYPQGRIVLVGAELLFRRETGASGLNGVMTLSTYPLLPWGQDWTRNLASNGIKQRFHSHRVFTNDGVEGTYVAARFLFRQEAVIPPGTEPSTTVSGTDDVANSFVPCNYAHLTNSTYLPDYAPPFWMNEATSDCRYPPTWLSVLGNGGFWPLAVMNFPTQPGSKSPPPIPELRPTKTRLGRLRQSVESIFWSLGFLFGVKPGDASVESRPQAWLPMPVSMQLLIFAALGWAIFHAICCSRASLTVRPAHRAHFVRPNECSGEIDRDEKYLHWQQNTHRALIMFGSILVALLPIILAWGYGEMWSGGEPLPNPWRYRALLSLTWAIGAFAACMNAWVEGYLFDQDDKVPALPTNSAIDLRFWKQILPPSRPPQGGTSQWKVPSCVWRSLTWFLALTVFLYWCIDFSLDGALNEANRIPTYWRSINLTTGLSPLVPLAALVAGLYGWFWYSLQGLAFLGEDRPRLPRTTSLFIGSAQPEKKTDTKKQDVLRMLSQEWAGDLIEDLSSPFAIHAAIVAAICFAGILVVGSSVFGFPSIRNLGSTDYSVVFWLWLVLCISILLANAWQFSRIWLHLRHLLQFLDKLPLRRTFPALDGIPWGSVWKMGGNVLDVRYKVIFRQLESLTMLQGSLMGWQGKVCAVGGQAPGGEEPTACRLISAIKETTLKRLAFAEWYSNHWANWKARRMNDLKEVQNSVAETAAIMLTQLLIPAWRQGGQPLPLGPNGRAELVSTAVEPGKAKQDKDKKSNQDKEEIPPYIRNAEQLVCLVYMAFIQNVLGRMRSLVMGMICVFLAITFAVASYPFDPRPLLSGMVVILFTILCVTIIAVYSQMHRDPTLSHLTGTTPGELGTDFWLKLVGFGAGPVLGLVATVFPQFTDFIFSWIQPGVASIK